MKTAVGRGCSTNPDYDTSSQHSHSIYNVPGTVLYAICILSFNEVGAIIVPFTHKATEVQSS